MFTGHCEKLKEAVRSVSRGGPLALLQLKDFSGNARGPLAVTLLKTVRSVATVVEEVALVR